jgi:hypothetical protein
MKTIPRRKSRKITHAKLAQEKLVKVIPPSLPDGFRAFSMKASAPLKMPEQMVVEGKEIISAFRLAGGDDLASEAVEEHLREFVLENYRRGRTEYVSRLPIIFKQLEAPALLLGRLDQYIAAYK